RAGGPEGAGARPGPICYGQGGTEPTITDANLILGRLDPERLLGVDHPVTLDHVRGLIEDKVGKRLGLDADAAAAAILRIANDRMAGAIRLCRCRAATTRAISRCSPSGARDRCTRRRWRASLPSRRCWCRRGPASPMHWVASSPTCVTTMCER